MKRLPACGVVQEEEEERKMVLVDRRKKRLAFASNSTQLYLQQS
jgi:hypothetical protein